MVLLNKLQSYLSEDIRLCQISKVAHAMIPALLLVLSYFYLYQPFELETQWNLKTLAYRIVGVGIVTVLYFSTYAIFYFLQERWRSSYRRYHYVVLVGVVIILSSIIIDGYESYLSYGNWLIDSVEVAQNAAKLTLIFMLPAGFFFVQHLKSSTTRAGTFVKFDSKFFDNNASNDDTQVLFKSRNGRETLKLKIGDIHYITSLENYVRVYYLKDGKLCSNILRNTLQSLERQLKHTSIVRCHRGHMVNLSKVYSMNKSNQRLYLKLLDVNDEIIVSRSYVTGFRKIFDQFTESSYKLTLS
ncbi:MAG: LytTR family DNA-binding domain-containing protein [Cyclobacteriaceae bacterium]